LSSWMPPATCSNHDRRRSLMKHDSRPPRSASGRGLRRLYRSEDLVRKYARQYPVPTCTKRSTRSSSSSVGSASAHGRRSSASTNTTSVEDEARGWAGWGKGPASLGNAPNGRARRPRWPTLTSSGAGVTGSFESPRRPSCWRSAPGQFTGYATPQSCRTSGSTTRSACARRTWLRFVASRLASGEPPDARDR
jgi:hypothetical protein